MPAPPATASSSWSTSTISSISEAVGVEAGIGGEQPGRVGEQHEQVGADEVGDQRGEAVVVAEADLVVGDGVVLVDDRHDAELEQAQQRAAGVQVLLALARSRAGRAAPGRPTRPWSASDVVVDPHEAALADGRDRLQGDGVAWAGVAAQPERGQAGGDRARA